MLQILKAYGIPTLLVDAIGKTYEETRANVFSPDGKPNYSKSPQAYCKEYTLAPYLFIIVLDYVLREAIEGHEESLGLTIKPRQGRTVKAEKVTDLNFADDIALFSDHFQQAQDLLRNVEEASVFYQMQRRQNTRSLTIMLILSSIHETTT